MPINIFSHSSINFLYHQYGNTDPTQMGHIVYNHGVFHNYDHLSKLLDSSYYDLETMYRDNHGMVKEHRDILIQNPMRGVKFLLPWKTMYTNHSLLDKFFSAGYYSKKVVKIPSSFRFKLHPKDSVNLVKKLPNDIVRHHLISFLNVEDQLNISQANKNWLREIRSNKHIQTSKLWLFKDGMEVIKRFFDGRIPKEVDEYHFWWLMSTKILLQDLWERWESYLDDEIQMQINIASNRCYWHDVDDEIDYYGSDEEYDG